MNTKRLSGAMVPVISVLLGLIAGAIIMLISGYNPLQAYGDIFQMVFLTPYYSGETVVTIIPLILSGLSVAFAFRAGLFNIGVEGQLLVGWLASVATALLLPAGLPKVIMIPACIIAAIIGGGIWGFIPGLLKARFKVHEVITTIMMNYIALHTTNAIIRKYFYAEGERTPNIPDSASLSSQFLYNLTAGSRMHWGIIVALIGAVVMWFILWRTSKGYELRAVGFNPDASLYAGMNVNRNMVLSFFISGAFAGVAGAMLGLGTYHYMTINQDFTGIGFDGIAVALLGLNSSFGVILGSILFAALETGEIGMQSLGIPNDLVQVIIALIIFFVASNYIIRWTRDRLKKKGGGAK
ncbi:ABC transporter permease [Pullulanibacillus camelliae]|uniref:ABC transporter permease n=1 Tax=Pullulanibacillus camelliae TaxID=1707096 RepID=A0A8J2YIB3_9BACL|nr:ABC transporter permease [Pullulanibacillus camelliae]GGE44734.1 ABC transporter permease [Pullulanibacillus camelliae]